jgi:hypothetical protein
MSNVRTLSPDDFTRYGDALKGKQVGDVITAEESYKLEKEYAKKNDEPVPVAIKPETGVTGVPSSVEGEESEAEETRATRRSSKK